MFHVKHTLAVLMLVSAVAHAQSVGGNSYGGHGARAGVGAGAGASNGSGGASQSGSNGGRYSAFDQYQPWPQAEMKQYAKAKFTPYEGK